MRVLLPFGIGLAIAAGTCVAAPRTGDPAAASADERFRGAARLPDSVLQTLLPGMRAVHIPEPGRLRYRGIDHENFQRNPGEHAIGLRERGVFRSLRIRYAEGLGLGSYRIRGGLCTILAAETEERCRAVFRLRDGGYALSTYEDPNTPAVRIRLEPIR